MIVHPPLNKCAVSYNDRYFVCEVVGENEYHIIESQSTRVKAVKGQQILTDHERKNGRSTVYVILFSANRNDYEVV